MLVARADIIQRFVMVMFGLVGISGDKRDRRRYSEAQRLVNDGPGSAEPQFLADNALHPLRARLNAVVYRAATRSPHQRKQIDIDTVRPCGARPLEPAIVHGLAELFHLSLIDGEEIMRETEAGNPELRPKFLEFRNQPGHGFETVPTTEEAGGRAECALVGTSATGLNAQTQ